MRAPFTVEEFLDAFGRFNTAAWPGHVLTWAIAAGVLLLAIRGSPRASRATALGLAGLWLVSAVHHASFSGVVPVAVPLALAFVAEAALLAVAGLRGRLAFAFRPGPTAVAGLALVAYAALLYPLVGALTGHVYPRAPAFGVAPCPNTIFTFGVLLLTQRPVPRWLLPIPAFWALVGISAAASLGVVQDWGLPVAGAVAITALAVRDRHHVARPADASPAGR